MNENLILPAKEKHHPSTALMLSYLTNKVSMKKLNEWKVFFEKRKDNNKLATKLFDTSSRLLVGEQVDEIDFMGLVWMVLRFNVDEELEKEKRKLEIEKKKLNIK